MLNLKFKSTERILLLDAEDFTSSYNSQLLGYLEDVPGFKVNDTLNFSTRTRIGSQERVPVLEAFNMYLQQLSRDTDRIIITL
tara:strand:- start:402 stop:650 length:249 start_codon:yes stop_codon:yes gene_type:complete